MILKKPIVLFIFVFFFQIQIIKQKKKHYSILFNPFFGFW